MQINKYFKCKLIKILLDRYMQSINNSQYRIVNIFDKYYPQRFNGLKWENVDIYSHWRNYSGRGSYTNAKQRLYIYISKEVDKAISMNKILTDGNIEYFSFRIL